jgi:hypothetical protein
MTDEIPILSAPPPEHWDESFAQGLVGKLMLVNLTILDAEGELEGREAFYGVVITADAEEGILLDLLGPQDGDTTTLPPQTSNITAAKPGLVSADGWGERREPRLPVQLDHRRAGRAGERSRVTFNPLIPAVAGMSAIFQAWSNGNGSRPALNRISGFSS